MNSNSAIPLPDDQARRISADLIEKLRDALTAEKVGEVIALQKGTIDWGVVAAHAPVIDEAVLDEICGYSDDAVHILCRTNVRAIAHDPKLVHTVSCHLIAEIEEADDQNVGSNAATAFRNLLSQIPDFPRNGAIAQALRRMMNRAYETTALPRWAAWAYLGIRTLREADLLYVGELFPDSEGLGVSIALHPAATPRVWSELAERDLAPGVARALAANPAARQDSRVRSACIVLAQKRPGKTEIAEALLFLCEDAPEVGEILRILSDYSPADAAKALTRTPPEQLARLTNSERTTLLSSGDVTVREAALLSLRNLTSEEAPPVASSLKEVPAPRKSRKR